MATVIPKLQILINNEKTDVTSVEAQLESGMQRVDTIDGEVLYTEGTKIITFNIEAPALPDGLQIDMFGSIVNGQDVKITFFIAGGKVWRGSGVLMTGGLGQSASAAQSQTVSIECKLNREPK